MIKYDAKEIGKHAARFFNEGCTSKVENVAGNFVSYFVLPQKLNPNLPDFAFRMTGDAPVYLIGVSDSIRPEFRRFVAFHELVEFTEIGDVADRCLEASQREIKAVEESDLTINEQIEYFQMRRKFFRNLVNYATEMKLSSEDIQEFEKSKIFFEKFCDMG